MRLELSELVLKYASLRVDGRLEQARLTASIAADGQQSAVAVVAACGDEAGHGYVLVDGYRRVTALRELGHDEVEAFALPLCEADALILAHRLERAGHRNALEQGWLLRALLEEHGLAQCELAQRLSRSRSWVSRRLSLVTLLPEVVQQAVREGRIAPHAAMKSLVPLARANRSDCARLVSNLGLEPVSVRELETLHRGWRLGDAQQRQRIIEQPRLFLKVQPDEPERTPTRRLLGDLEAITRLSWRARRQLDEGDVDCTHPRVRRVSRDMQRGFNALFTHLQEEMDAGPRHPNGGATAVCAGTLEPSDRQGAEAEPQHGAQGVASGHRPGAGATAP